MRDDIEPDTYGIVTTGVEDAPETRAFNEEHAESLESFTNRA